MKISNDISTLIYSVSKKVFEGTLTFQEGLQQLVSNNRINRSSASYYINNFQCMFNGKKFSRTNNAYSMEFFFENVYKDYGSKGLNNAVTALRLHIEYYENNRKVKMRKLRGILDKYSGQTFAKDEHEQEEIIKTIKSQQKSRLDIINELINLKPSDPKEVTINGKTYKRDNKTIAQLKIIRDFKCQICSTSIKKRDGSLYIEAAHIDPKHKKGHETPDNILLLCPNHHKEFDLGDKAILQRTGEMIKFTLNDNEFSISLKLN